MTAAQTPISDAQVPHLVALLRKQHGVYEQIQALGNQQSGLVEQADADALLSLLQRRQRHIDELDAINKELEPFRLGWLEWLPRLAAQDRTRIAQLVEQISAVRDQIVAQDDRDCRRLREVQGRYGQELGRMNRGGRAAHSYRGAGGASASVSRLTDQQG
ncbi:MAG: hypothetical protein WD042_10800 [Phycisphaeraceae bacterium]